MNPEETTGTEPIDELIEKSSLGTPGAQQLRRRTPRRQAAAAVRASQEKATRTHDVPASWIDAALHGDRDAVEKILAFVQPIIRRYCKARLGETAGLRSSVDDVVQEVCIAALVSLPTYRDTGRPFLAYIYGIASQKVLDAQRSLEESQPIIDDKVPDHGGDPVDIADASAYAATLDSLRENVAEMLAALPAQEREVIILRVVVGLTAEQTAQAIGSTPGAVRVAQSRALSRLRRESPEALDSLTGNVPRSSE